MTKTEIKLAKEVRSLLVDKTGDDEWMQVALEKVFGIGPDNCDDDAEAFADAILEQGYAPEHVKG